MSSERPGAPWEGLSALLPLPPRVLHPVCLMYSGLCAICFWILCAHQFEALPTVLQNPGCCPPPLLRFRPLGNQLWSLLPCVSSSPSEFGAFRFLCVLGSLGLFQAWDLVAPQLIPAGWAWRWSLDSLHFESIETSSPAGSGCSSNASLREPWTPLHFWFEFSLPSSTAPAILNRIFLSPSPSKTVKSQHLAQLLAH